MVTFDKNKLVNNKFDNKEIIMASIFMRIDGNDSIKGAATVVDLEQ